MSLIALVKLIDFFVIWAGSMVTLKLCREVCKIIQIWGVFVLFGECLVMATFIMSGAALRTILFTFIPLAAIGAFGWAAVGRYTYLRPLLGLDDCEIEFNLFQWVLFIDDSSSLYDLFKRVCLVRIVKSLSDVIVAPSSAYLLLVEKVQLVLRLLQQVN